MPYSTRFLTSNSGKNKPNHDKCHGENMTFIRGGKSCYFDKLILRLLKLTETNPFTAVKGICVINETVSNKVFLQSLSYFLI